jgi:tryptophan synthase alpha chain
VSRIAQRFRDLQARGRTALIPFVTAGDPDPSVTVGLMHAMVRAGSDLIELGVPFSDPIADGPVIQRASERALANHTSLHDVLAMVRAFRADDAETPVVLMGYLNPIEVMGYQAFAAEAKQSGVDGALVVDVPPEESHDLVVTLRDAQIDLVFLLAPTSTEDRIRKIAAAASGFVYYVSVKGVTGAANLDTRAVTAKVSEIRRFVDLPVGVGFGIKDAETAARVSAAADAVIVGSALVGRIESLSETPELIEGSLASFLSELRSAIDAADAR